MGGRWWHDCPGPIDLTSLEAAIEYLYLIGAPAGLGPGTGDRLAWAFARAVTGADNPAEGFDDEPATQHRGRS